VKNVNRAGKFTNYTTIFNTFTIISTQTKQKKQDRWQVTLTKNSGLNELVEDLKREYQGMTLSEITKLAWLTLKKETVWQSKPVQRKIDKTEFKKMVEKSWEVGKKAFADHGLNVDEMTDEDAYNFFNNLK